MMIEGLITQCVTYFSKKFTNAQTRYCSTKKEPLLALILALKYFDTYVAAAGGPIAVFTDNNLLTFLHKLEKTRTKGSCDGASFYCSIA